MTKTPSAGLPTLIVLAVLLGFASISTDLFLPALPAMQVALGAGEGTLQFAISGYLLGFGFGQLFWGPISDRFGRRGPIALGVLMFALGRPVAPCRVTRIRSSPGGSCRRLAPAPGLHSPAPWCATFTIATLRPGCSPP